MAGTGLRRALLGAVGLAAALAAPALAGASDVAIHAGTAAVSIAVSSTSNLRVIPFPGTPDASPSSQVIFSALRPAELFSVTVQGSRSGRHSGHLTLLPDDAGTAFVPDQPFAPGERVEVSALLHSPAAGTASGAPGATQLGFSFQVAVPAPMGAEAAGPTTGTAQGNDHTRQARIATVTGRTQSFRSQDNFHPPAVNATSDPDSSSGDIFLTPNNSPQVGSMILNARGQLVWFRRVTHSATFNLQVQHYQGQPVLTWWHGNVFQGHGTNGQDVIMNRHYQVMRILHAGNGYSSDLHEFQITGQGTALIDCYVPVKANLSSVGGPANGQVLDNVIQELDIKTGQVLWEWHAFGHIPLTASHQKINGSRPYDFFHINSIQQQPNDNLLISARNTWSVYLIGEQRGHVIWTVDGSLKHSSFQMGKGTNFEWQHDARLIGQTLSLFDDAGIPQQESQSSGKQLTLSRSAMTATLHKTYDHSPPVSAGAMGSFQTLPNQNVFVGWGTQPDFSEYTSSGQQIFNGSFPLGTTSYRAYRFNWSGQPQTPPSMANLPQSNGEVKVYSSWNGATQVASWRVLGGSQPGSLSTFTSGPSTGFETALVIQSEPQYVAVQALDSSGHVLGTSKPRTVRSHLAIFGSDDFVPTSGGDAWLPVGCFTGHDCQISVKVNWGSRVVAQTGSQPVHSRTGALVHFQLSSTGLNALNRAAGQKMRVLVSIHDSSGGGASEHMILFGYRVSGQDPPRASTQSPTIQIARTTGFVSSTGQGQLLGACYGGAPCHPQATITSGGTVIARTKKEHVGAEELGNVYFKLTPRGQTMLENASGNQLAAQVKLTNGGDSASGQIVLVRYG